MPEPYPARCSKHYLADVAKAQADASKRFKEEMRPKLIAKGINPKEVGF